jgi:hypothetical protein
MLAEIRIWEILRPAVQNPGQGGNLPAARGRVPLQDEHQDDVALRGEICHILGDGGPAIFPGRRGDLRVISSPQACLGDMDSSAAIRSAQHFGCGHRIPRKPHPPQLSWSIWFSRLS